MIAVTFVFFFVADVASKTTFEFPPIEQVHERAPFTSFKRWMTIEAGKNDLSFYFKTTQRNAFLFYEQHYASSTFIHGALRNGKVKLIVRMSELGECNRGSVSVPEEKNLDDSKWHKVVIQFDEGRYIKLQVDNYGTKTIKCKNSVIASRKEIKTDVFVGALKCDNNTSLVETGFCYSVRNTRLVVSV